MLKSSKLAIFPFLFVFYEISVYLSMDAYIPALPEITEQLATTSNITQLTATVWFIGAISLQFFIGPISEQFGRRPVLLIGGITYVIATIACGLCSDINHLMVARLFQGMAVPTMIIPGYAAVNELFNRNEAIKILAKMQSVTVLAPSFGPILGGLLLYVMTWNGIFFFLSVFASVALVLLFFIMPETLPKENRKRGVKAKQIVCDYMSLVRNGKFIGSLFAMCLLFSTLIPWMLVGPYIVIDQFQYSPIYFGFFQFIVFGAFICGNRVINRYMNEGNIFDFVNVGISITFVAAMVQIILDVILPEQLFVLLVTMMFIAFGVGIVSPILNRLTIESSDVPMGQRIAFLSAGVIC